METIHTHCQAYIPRVFRLPAGLFGVKSAAEGIFVRHIAANTTVLELRMCCYTFRLVSRS